MSLRKLPCKVDVKRVGDTYDVQIMGSTHNENQRILRKMLAVLVDGEQGQVETIQFVLAPNPMVAMRPEFPEGD